MLSKARSYLRYHLAQYRRPVRGPCGRVPVAYWITDRQTNSPVRRWIGSFVGYSSRGRTLIGSFRDRARRYFPYVGMTSGRTQRGSAREPWNSRVAYYPQSHAFDVVSPGPRPGNIAERLQQLKRRW